MPTHARATHARTKKRSVPTIIGDCILQVLAAGGVVCIALVICAVAFDIIVLGAITLTMAALVVAVFWPRNTDDDDDAELAEPKTEPIQVLLPPDGGRQ
jgi:hypothetical protein